MFDSLVERWEIAFTDAFASSSTANGTTRIGRDLSGSPVEVVLDRAVLTPDDVSVISEIFGPSVADLLTSLDPVSVDLVVAVQPTPSARASGGVPARTESGDYEVATRSGRTLKLVVQAGSLNIRIPGQSVSGSWVTVSVAASGQLIALAPVRDDPDQPGSSSAEVPFGLDMDPEDLSIDVTSEPLLNTSAGDTPIAARPRWRRVLWLLALIVVVAIGGLLVLQGGESMTPGVAGPARYEYADGDGITATLLGRIDDLAADDGVRLSLVVSVRERGGYGPAPGSVIPENERAEAEQDAREVCLSVTDLPLTGPTMIADSRVIISLVRVDNEGAEVTPVERVNIDSVTIDAPFVMHTSVKQACLEARLGGDMFLAATDFVRQEVLVDVDLPEPLKSGRWRIDLVLDDQSAEFVDPLVVNVD